MSNTLDSVQIEPSCSDVGFGEVLHTMALRREESRISSKADASVRGASDPFG